MTQQIQRRSIEATLHCKKCRVTIPTNMRDIDKDTEAHAWGDNECDSTPADLQQVAQCSGTEPYTKQRCTTIAPIGDHPEYPGWPHLQTAPHRQGKDGRVAGALPGEGECKYCRQNSSDRHYGTF